MRKKILALTLCAAMVFSLAACKKNNNENDTTTSQESTLAEEATTEAVPVTQTKPVNDYSEYVKLGAYTGLEIAEDKAVVTQELIDEYKNQILYYYNEYVVQPAQIKEGVTKEGDNINLDFSGLLDDVAFDNGTATGASYTCGSGQFISDLDKQLIGLEVGKEYRLPCKFPEDYKNNPDLAGKDVIFVVTVNYIEGEKELVEWNDEFVKLYTTGDYDTTQAYEVKIAEELLEDVIADQEKAYNVDLWAKIVEGCEFVSLPEEKLNAMYEDYINYYNDYFEYYAQLYGMDKAAFLLQNYNMTQEDLEKECHEMAETEIKYIIVACEIYKNLGMTLSDEEYNEKAQASATASGFANAQELIEEYGEDYVKESIIFEIVGEYVNKNNTMVVNE